MRACGKCMAVHHTRDMARIQCRERPDVYSFMCATCVGRQRDNLEMVRPIHQYLTYPRTGEMCDSHAR